MNNCALPWSRTKSFGVKVVRVSEAAAVYKLETPETARDYWQKVIARKRWFDESKEHLVVILLSTRYKVEGHSLVSIGTMNESIAHPREIFRAAIAGGAFAIVLMHNHPSGDPAPSVSDLCLTRRLEQCADLLQIRLLDHVVVGKGESYWSFKENPAGMKTPGRKTSNRAESTRRLKKALRDQSRCAS